MTSPQLSPDDQKRAAQIYKRTSWTLRTVLAVVGLPSYFGLHRAFPHLNDLISSIFWIGLLMVLYSVPDVLARAQLRKLGLSLERVERRILWRSTDVIPTKLLEFKAKGQLNSNTLRAIMIWLLSIAATFGVSIHFPILGHSLDPQWRANLTMVISLIPLYIYNFWESRLAVLRLDEKGVGNGTVFLWPRTVPWSQVADVEETRTWDYKGEEQPVRVSFRSTKGKALLRVLSTPGGSFVQEVEATLHGESKISPT